MPSYLRSISVSCLLGLAAAAIFGFGFANYDTVYSLFWGREIFAGERPDYGAVLAPTPHPLITLYGILLAPFSSLAESITPLISFFLLGVIGLLVYRIGSQLFNPYVGVLAASVVLTREPLLSFAARAYIDVPYLALILWALLVELRSPRAGVRVLLILAVAGLIRPEAWLFSGIYLLYLLAGESSKPRGIFQQLKRQLEQRKRLTTLLLATFSAPVLWLLTDLAASGDPLHSFSQTGESVEILGRNTGLGDVPTSLPWRIGEIVREPILAACFVLLPIVLLWLKPHSRSGAFKLLWATFWALVAFVLLAASGMPIITRYLLLPAVLLSLLAAFAVFEAVQLIGKRRLSVAATVAAFAVFLLPQLPRIQHLEGSIATQKSIREDLRSLLLDLDVRPGCGIVLPNHRSFPDVALWLELKPSKLLLKPPSQAESLVVIPANQRVADYTKLDRNAPGDQLLKAPPGARQLVANDSWRIFTTGKAFGPCTQPRTKTT